GVTRLDLAKRAAKERVRQADLVLAPVQSVRLVGLPFAMAPETALEVARTLSPSTWVATGVDPAHAHGLLPRAFLWCRGSVEEFRRLGSTEQPGTRLRELAQGEAVTV
ncbi:MAG: hypothetical protein ACO248_05835, partial [Burkholderiaceae bacterium]